MASQYPTGSQEEVHESHLIDVGLPFFLECLPYDQVNAMAKLLVAGIYNYQKILFDILERFEPLLRKRWIKKSNQQRRSILSAAFGPNMPQNHRPDVGALHRRRATKSIYKFYTLPDHFMLPAINLEDLSMTRSLLLFLHSRGRQPPALFVPPDFASIRVGIESSTLHLPHVHGYTINLDGQTSETYGRLEFWGKDDDMRRKIESGQGMLPGVAILILAIQKRKLEFLFSCAELILHDIAVQDPCAPTLPDPGEPILGTDTTEWDSVSKEVVEAPYRVPPRFDVSALRSLVFAKRAECEDEIWALREDPLHFKESLWEWSEHRREQVRSEEGVVDPSVGQEEWWETVISTMIADKYTSFHCWDCISRHVEQLVTLKESYGSRIDQDNAMPKDYDFAIAYLEFAVSHAMVRPMNKWSDGVASSPPLRKYFASDFSKGEGWPKIDLDKEKDEFLWLMSMPLFGKRISCFGIENIMDRLDWLVRTYPQNKHRVTRWVANLFSELSLLSELRRQATFLNNRPIMAWKENEYSHEKKVKLDSDTKNIEQVYWMFNNGLKFVPHALPLDKFNYPCHKRRTAASTVIMQQAERALDAFWQNIDANSLKVYGKTLHQLFDGSIEERDLARTPDWSEEDNTARISPRPKRSSETSLEDHLAAVLELEKRTEQTIGPDTINAPKQKPKTRGIPTNSPRPSSALSSTSTQPDPAPEEPRQIAVSKRTLAVFSTLFFTNTHEDVPGEIAWSEFLHAMASMGFGTKKLEGSAWIFTHPDMDFRRSIIFHEPHPGNKVPFYNARRMGRRLERAFGWTGNIFKKA